MNELTPHEEQRVRAALRTIAEEHTVLDQDLRQAAPPRRSGGRAAWVSAAAAVLLIGGGGAALMSAEGSPRPAHRALAPSTAPLPTNPGTTLNSSITYDLGRLVRESPRIVVGTVTDLRHGSGEAAGGLPYVLAHIRVREAIRGAAGDLWAFDYDLGSGGAISSVPSGPPWRVGEDVLLFLSSSSGTVHEGVAPAHEQVSGGAQGRYEIVDGELRSAPFTLEQVRKAAS